MSRRLIQYGIWGSVWLACMTGTVAAQQRSLPIEFNHIREQEGLSSRVVYCLLQDRDGFLWVGTNNGLDRYDGTHFVPFKTQRSNHNSLINNQLYSLCEDRQGRIWMSAENGVSRYDKITGRFYHITTVKNQPLGICKNICCDRAGDVWFTSRNRGLYRYVTKTSAVEYFPGAASDSTGGVRTLPNGLIEDPFRAGLWVSERSGLRYFDITRREFTSHRQNPEHLPVFTPNWTSAIAIDGDRLLIADNTDRSIIVYDLRLRRIMKRLFPSKQSDRDDFEIATIFVDRRHNLWLSSWSSATFFIDGKTDGILRLNYDKTKPTSLGANSFWAGWQHPDGSVWLGTVNGIAYANMERALYDVYDLGVLFPALTDEQGIMSFAEDIDGSWWFGTSIRGLLHYRPATNQLDVYRLPNRTSRYPWGMPAAELSLRGNEIFVGSDHAVYRFSKQTKRFRELALPAEARLDHSGPYLLDGNRYWVFGHSKLAFSYDLTRQRWQTYPIRSVSKDPEFLVRRALVNRQGDLWIDIHPEGFARFSPKQNCFVVTDTRQADYEATICSLAEDRDGSFLMATTMHGLVSYDPVRGQDWVRPENERMALSQCTAALPDKFGNTWVANFNIVSVITPRKQVMNVRLSINEYTTEYATRLYSMRNGHIMSIQKGHVVEFKPENIRPTRTPEPVLLNRIVLPDTTLLLHTNTPALQLKAEDNSFTVEFSALSASVKDRYLYKLDGYDEHWMEAGLRTDAVYTKLPGGQYVFTVKSVSSEGIETPSRSLTVLVATHFYQATWFWLLIGLLVAGLLIVFFRYRTLQTAQIYRLRLQATRLEHDKTQIQYQNLINHLNPHFLFNSLTSLNSLILTKPREASDFLQKLSVIYRYILQNKDSELVSLSDELAFTQHYIDLQSARFGDGLQISLNVGAEYLTRRIVPVTIQNLLENAIKHNIIDEEIPLQISIYCEDETLFVLNTLQKKDVVKTSNKQGLVSLKSLYGYLSQRPVRITETATQFVVAIPLLA